MKRGLLFPAYRNFVADEDHRGDDRYSERDPEVANPEAVGDAVQQEQNWGTNDEGYEDGSNDSEALPAHTHTNHQYHQEYEDEQDVVESAHYDERADIFYPEIVW